MILEAAILTVKKGQEDAFESAFKKARHIISKMNGYVSHSLQKCIEKNNQYMLYIYWKTLEDHTIGFRQSKEYQEWKQLLHHFYDPFPQVLHYEELK
jgi:heme-degrading monooxygenase HmoA